MIFSTMGGYFCGLISLIISPLLSATNTLPSMLFLLILSQGFWFFGIHGDNLRDAVITPILTANFAANLAAYQAGQTPEFVLAGMALNIFACWLNLIAMTTFCCFFTKSTHLKTIGRLSIIPSIFDVGEPNLFGVPVVMNPYMIIPWMVVPLIDFTLYYVLASAGILGKVIISLPWTTPLIFSTWLSTMDIKCLFFGIAIVLLDWVLYYPFWKAYDASLLAQEQAGENE